MVGVVGIGYQRDARTVVSDILRENRSRLGSAQGDGSVPRGHDPETEGGASGGGIGGTENREPQASRDGPVNRNIGSQFGASDRPICHTQCRSGAPCGDRVAHRADPPIWTEKFKALHPIVEPDADAHIGVAGKDARGHGGHIGQGRLSENDRVKTLAHGQSHRTGGSVEGGLAVDASVVAPVDDWWGGAVDEGKFKLTKVTRCCAVEVHPFDGDSPLIIEQIGNLGLQARQKYRSAQSDHQ